MKRTLIILLLAFCGGFATYAQSTDEEQDISRNRSKYANDQFSDDDQYTVTQPYETVKVTQPKSRKIKNVIVMIGGWGKNANGFSEMAKDPEKRKLFSYAESDSGGYIDNKAVLEWVDYINVMTYSMGDPPYHNSPLYRSSLTRKRSGEESIEIIHEQGVPYDRMNYGIGFYGHGDGTVYPSSVQYYKAVEALEKGTVDGKSVKGYNIRWWDDTGKNCYLGDASGKMYASYEDVESIGYRVDFVKSKKMLGAFAWEYREDDSKGTLRHALHDLMMKE